MIEALPRSHELVFENTEAKYCALAVYGDGSSVDFADTLIPDGSYSDRYENSTDIERTRSLVRVSCTSIVQPEKM